ncbi:Holliday junction resolvase RuvX [Bifidobacterium crudilactis]|jgi:putative Holliday junction resolvase|uniref:Holliday junction resolvase RuvX n=1 Tax=Bifidobacterium crudilactis TaxID=327277 RepID=UPI0023548E42|nr:Holliday junction resolvase RuvX [Bifidobacterium crudilactis]MCI1217748.1 Holliday junction resolvase RuvX [Bifidobacterium crudilactis]MCI1637804.1 Holliday junction resolvase RuvX [Bifidobacterium crudilactis]
MPAPWLGVDLGDARVGLALSDPELTFAHPAGNVVVEGDSFLALDSVIDVIEQESVAVVVVGLPLLLDGTRGRSGKKAVRWVNALSNRLRALMADGSLELNDIPQLRLLDERLTTVSAHRQLRDAKVAGRDHRPFVDQQSAVVLLQSALDSRQTLKE